MVQIELEFFISNEIISYSNYHIAKYMYIITTKSGRGLKFAVQLANCSFFLIQLFNLIFYQNYPANTLVSLSVYVHVSHWCKIIIFLNEPYRGNMM